MSRPPASNVIGGRNEPIFYASNSPGGDNFSFATAQVGQSLASTSSSTTAQGRLPRTPVQPTMRPQAWRQDDEGGDGFASSNSAWLRWTRERRVSLARKNQREARDSITAIRDLQAVRTSFPDARDSGLPPLQPPPPPMSRQRPYNHHNQHQQPRKGRRRGRRHEVTEADLSMTQWNRLLAFWQHPTFNRARIASMVFVVAAMAVGVTSVSCRAWSFHRMSDNVTQAASGLWDTCFTANDSCISAFDLPTSNSDASDWQKSVASLLVSSVLLSAIGSIVALCGFWASYLPRKIYYFHSSGEIFFLSAVLATISAGIYPYSLQRFLLQAINYGYGYGLGWATACLQYLAAFCMMLDMLVRESSRPLPCARFHCCRCCRQEHDDYGMGRPLMA